MKKRLSGILTLLLALVVQVSFAQEKTVTGTVTDSQGVPLPGVNVLIKDTSRGTQTDFDGNFSISAAQGEVVVFSYLGFETAEFFVGESPRIDVTLSEDTAELDEVIVVGYGATSRELSTSAVSTVSSETIENFVPSTSADNILQGKAAGVQVTAANGRPGQTAFVQIRGIGSINAGSTPLYVVDGTPINAADVNNINPQDIASMSVLKDAATVSKYGSRGANGVILITTKSGQKGDARITLRSSLGTSRKIDDINYDMMNATQKLELERQYAELGLNTAASLPGGSASPERLEVLRSLDNDWQDIILRDALVQSNSLSISGGEEKLTYFMSLGYDKDEGIIDRLNGFERLSARLNSTFQAKEWLEVGTNLSFARSTTDLPRDRYNAQNPFYAMYAYNPYETLYSRDAQGEIVNDADGNPEWNPTHQGFPVVPGLSSEPEDRREFMIVGSLFADVKFSDKFSNRFQLGLSNTRMNRTSRSIAGGILQSIVGSGSFPGTQTDASFIDFEYNVNNLFTYSDTYDEVHNVNASILLEYNENIYTSASLSSRGFPSPDIPYQSVAAEPTAGSTSESRNMLFSQGLFLDYNYDGRYILSGSVRRDGSSRFGPDNKYGIFYSGSAAWNIAQESFMEGSAFDDLKLRASYGTAGNQSIGDFNYLDLLGFETYNGMTTAIPEGVGNPLIQWESQAILDIGVEFGLWNNRISGVVDYYKKSSQDLLLNRPISQIVGDEDNSILSNVGEIQNSGIEVSLNANIIRNQDWRWTVGGNVGFLDNEVVSLVGGEDIIRGGTILREGEEINTHYDVRYAGVNPANGQPLYYDADGNITAEHSTSNAVALSGKSPQADLEGGFFTSLRYKGLGLRADFVFKGGNYIYNQMRQDGNRISSITSNQRTEAFNYWREPGDVNVHPNPIYQATADLGSTRWLEPGDYLRLRNLTVDYNVPGNFLESVGITNLRIFATGQNLLTWTNYSGDPEIGIGSAETVDPTDADFVPGEFALYSYPQTQSYTAGFELSF